MILSRSLGAFRAAGDSRRTSYSYTYTALPSGQPAAAAAAARSRPWSSGLAEPGALWRRSRLARLAVCTALGLLLVGAAAVYAGDYGLLLLPAGTLPAVLARPPPLSQIRQSKKQYIEAVLRNPVEGVLDPAPIRQKCDETQFQEGLVWHCDTIVGGIGNVGNMLLNCVRYAMEAGATTLILPRLGARGDDLVDLGSTARSVDLSTLVDVDYFLEAWAAVCPQMRAVAAEADVAAAATGGRLRLPLPAAASARSPHLAPARVAAFPMRKYLVVDPTGWRAAFDAWLAARAPNVSAAAPVRVWQDMALAQWNREAPAAHHSPAFARAFPRLFRAPPAARRLAAAVLWQLEQALGRPAVADRLLEEAAGTLSPSSSSSSSSSSPPHANDLDGRPGRLAADAFLGVHMRVAADAAQAGWAGYEAQAPFFLAEAARRNLSAVYLATGSAAHAARFRADAAAAGVRVFTKEDLLLGGEDDEDDEDLRAALAALSWDQAALVDFAVLVHSSWFYGFVRSSFSWALALRRGTLPEAGPSQVTDALGDEYRDNLSAVVGRYPDINPEGLWP